VFVYKVRIFHYPPRGINEIDSEKEGLFHPSNSIPALPMGMPMAKGQGYSYFKNPTTMTDPK